MGLVATISKLSTRPDTSAFIYLSASLSRERTLANIRMRDHARAIYGRWPAQFALNPDKGPGQKRKESGIVVTLVGFGQSDESIVILNAAFLQ